MKFNLTIFLLFTVVLSTNKREKPTKLNQFSLKRFFNLNRNETCRSRWYARNLPAKCVPNPEMFQEKFKQHCCLPDAVVDVNFNYLQKYRAKYTENDGFLPRAFQPRVKNQQFICYTATTNKTFLRKDYQDKSIDLHGCEFQLAMCSICCDSDDVYLACENNHVFCQPCLDTLVLHSNDQEMVVRCPLCKSDFAKSYRRIHTERFQDKSILLRFHARKNPHYFTKIFGYCFMCFLFFLFLNNSFLQNKLKYFSKYWYDVVTGIIVGLFIGSNLIFFLLRPRLIDYFYGPYHTKEEIIALKYGFDRFFHKKVNIALLILGFFVEVYLILFQPSYENVLKSFEFIYFSLLTFPLVLRIFWSRI